jgi:hypothetical protein
VLFQLDIVRPAETVRTRRSHPAWAMSRIMASIEVNKRPDKGSGTAMRNGQSRDELQMNANVKAK